MKYIVLAAGKGIESIQDESSLPKCLVSLQNNKNIIDNILDITSELKIKDVSIIGGYKILEIMKQYPQLKYFYNEKWEETNSLYSLSKAIEYMDDDILISYSDTLYSKETIEKIIQKNEKINIVYDSYWKKRYEGKPYIDNEVEKIYKLHENQLKFSKEEYYTEIKGEFTGLLYIPRHEILDFILAIDLELKQNIKTSLLEFLNSYTKGRNNINLIDIQGNWAELDSVQDIEHFSFGTKAETLNTLKNKISIAKVLEQFTFTVLDYRNNSKEVLKNIQNSIKEKLLVVRSSAINEDTHSSSMAGNYQSILKVEKDNTLILQDAIEKVVNSYLKNNQQQDDNNQVLIQPYLQNVTMSGVLFSKNLQTSSPYYTVNYDESADTESVTSGNGKDLNTFICYRKSQEKIENEKLDLLIKAVKEIETITKYDAIDIEFAFVKSKLYILQARPIAAKKNSIRVLESDIEKELNDLKKFIQSRNDNSINLLGGKIAYGVMPDWNPAEIIGINPKNLAFDLYKYIITDTIWARSRKELGYKDVKNANGLVSFAGKPYVDIKMSFNTFIPQEIDDNTASKLINYFIHKLRLNPSQHDKVEFSIAITAFDFLFDKRMNELKENGFNEYEVKQIFDAYKRLTEDIVNEISVSIDEELAKAYILEKRRDDILSSNISLSAKIYNLLEDCKVYGTLPFAKLARCGFVGSILLKSLLKKKIIDTEEYDEFSKSIHTVAKTFVEDLEQLQSNQITKSEFISKYGHLRPGTYDITSPSYKDNFDNYIQINLKNDNELESRYLKHTISENFIMKIEREIASYNLNFNAKKLLNFIVKATEARELSKFEFTKNLNAVLELIMKMANDFNISKGDAAHFNLDYILRMSNSSSTANIKNDLENMMARNKTKHLISKAVHLPELIFNVKDIEMFFYSQLKPNFISHHSVMGKTVKLKNHVKQDIKDKVVMIENADPGFDWIFSHEIKGLVTKYGGAASHMAIRCAEFDIAAAIGCGDKIFNELIKHHKILLDCSNQIVRGLK